MIYAITAEVVFLVCGLVYCFSIRPEGLVRLLFTSPLWVGSISSLIGWYFFHSYQWGAIIGVGLGQGWWILNTKFVYIKPPVPRSILRALNVGSYEAWRLLGLLKNKSDINDFVDWARTLGAAMHIATAVGASFQLRDKGLIAFDEDATSPVYALTNDGERIAQELANHFR